MAVLVLGVLAMHAVPAPRAADPSQDSMPMSAPSSPALAPALPGPAQPAADQPGHRPDSDLHHVLAACLAVLGAGVLLAAAAAVFLALRRQEDGTARVRVVPTVVAVAPRPPPAHAVRLAQLCVLRN